MNTTVTIKDIVATAVGRWRWRKARNLTDLANLQADRIARHLAGNYRGPERAMYSTLVALGRAGVVVHDWRLGNTAVDSGTILETRDCVTGLADDDTKYWLDNLLYYAGKEPGATKYELSTVLALYAPGRDWGRHPGRGVERIGGFVTARIGGSLDTRQVYRAFPTRPSVQDELRTAWHISICGRWGSSKMFDDLLPLVSGTHRPASQEA